MLPPLLLFVSLLLLPPLRLSLRLLMVPPLLSLLPLLLRLLSLQWRRHVVLCPLSRVGRGLVQKVFGRVAPNLGVIPACVHTCL